MYPYYDGNDLGAVYTKDKTAFRVWSPTAQKVTLRLYQAGTGDNLIKETEMKHSEGGTWYVQADGDLHGVYYTYMITRADKSVEVVDIYAKAVGVNGNRGMVVDLERTNPDDFDKDVRPTFSENEALSDTDAIIYEVHYRDLSVDALSGIKNKGKFLSLTERGTKNQDGLATGLDHILELGITHVQIQPSYDYATIDESKTDSDEYNWGYDPKNYNVPEGSYSTDAFHGEIRIIEMKEMIQTLHANGLRVNMDVVYNHTYNVADSWFHKTEPDYYHRLREDGTYSDGSACGNETASEHLMMRKYMIDSVVYWAKEYHIDGFRFDLMGIHDMETMKLIRAALDEIDSSIMLYGEGWSGGSVALSQEQLALKKNTYQMERVGAFSDDIRDAIKGNVFLDKDRGFVNGKAGMEEAVKFGVVGAIAHPQVHYSENAWTKAPGQSINYVSCHDNYTLWDKLSLANGADCETDRIRMNLLAAAIIFTAQGVPFILAGEELLRSKPDMNGGFVENSFCSPDSVNCIRWGEKKQRIDVFNYYKGLIKFRKSHAELRLQTADEVRKRLKFVENLPDNVIAYIVDDLFVIYNANPHSVEISLPQGEWEIFINDKQAGCESQGSAKNNIAVERISAMVLQKKL